MMGMQNETILKCLGRMSGDRKSGCGGSTRVGRVSVSRFESDTNVSRRQGRNAKCGRS
jgi:hypothetical protein